MKRFFAAFIVILLVTGCVTKKSTDVYTVVVSLDAFLWDYPALCQTPNLDSIAAKGVRCVMEPSYPASTFPNHYTIATGLVPDHHGIVNGSFWCPETGKKYSMSDSLVRYNPDYYLGEPIWVTAEKARVTTASIYWVGSDVAIKDTYPTHYFVWDRPRLSYEERADEAVRLLSLPEDQRPRLVMVYIDDPDMTSHAYGPDAPETKAMVERLDSLMGSLYRKLMSLPIADKINLIVTADHGMTEISPERFVNIRDYVKEDWCEYVIGSAPTNIYTKGNCADSVYQALVGVEHISVWKHGAVPEEYNYGTSNRTGDVIVAPDLGWQFGFSPRTLKGAHGFSPKEKDMQVSFTAVGPSFKAGYWCDTVAFKNIDIYPMLADILGITPAKTDGKLENTKSIRK